MPKLILYHPLYAPQLVLLFKKLHASNPKSLLSPLRCAFVHVEIWGTREKYCEHDDEHGKSELRCTDNSGVSDATFPIWEHFANMFCMCFFDRLYFYNSVHQRRSFSLVPEKGMFCLIQDLRVWQDYCEALDVTSLLFQKPVQFPLNHEATSTNNK